MKKYRLWFLAGVAAASAQAALINFDGTGAPDVFVSTTALRDTYAGLGVHFLGSTGANDGGGILNQTSDFGVNALSGTDFLAFNNIATFSDGGIPRMNEIINFDADQSFVSIFISGGNNNDFMRLEGFASLNGTGGSLGFDQHTAPNGDWSQFIVNAAGIRSVVISAPDADGEQVADDLSFSTQTGGGVPEPATLVLLPAGLLAMAGIRRLRRV